MKVVNHNHFISPFLSFFFNLLESFVMKRFIWLIILLSFGIQSCTSVSEILGIAKNIGITWEAEKAKSSKPIDSIVVRFNSVYWKESQKDSLAKEFEKQFTKDGYNVWKLSTPKLIRYEVTRKDTIIYIYEK